MNSSLTLPLRTPAILLAQSFPNNKNTFASPSPPSPQSPFHPSRNHAISLVSRRRYGSVFLNPRPKRCQKPRFHILSMSSNSKSIPEGRAKPEWTPEVEMLVNGMKWDSNGLVVAIAQSELTGAILMQGFANRDAIAATLSSGRATFYSRSRKSLWTKGETSKNFITVKNVYIDCDRDSVIYLGRPDGSTCHTGADTCFFTTIQNSVLDKTQISDEKPSMEPLSTLYELERTIEERKKEKENEKKMSWTKKLLKNPTLLCSKIREEADEYCRTLEEKEGKERATSEMADLLYHSMVLMNIQGVTVEDVMRVLNSRFSISGIQEKLNRTKSS